MDITEDPLLSTKQIAKLFGVTPYTIRKWINDDRMKAVRLNGQLKVRRSEVNRYAQEMFGDEEEND